MIYSSKLSGLTPGYCRAYFDRLSTSPLFDEKKRGFVMQNIPLKNTKNFLFKTPLSFFPKRGAGVSAESFHEKSSGPITRSFICRFTDLSSLHSEKYEIRLQHNKTPEDFIRNLFSILHSLCYSRKKIDNP